MTSIVTRLKSLRDSFNKAFARDHPTGINYPVHNLHDLADMIVSRVSPPLLLKLQNKTPLTQKDFDSAYKEAKLEFESYKSSLAAEIAAVQARIADLTELAENVELPRAALITLKHDR